MLNPALNHKSCQLEQVIGARDNASLRHQHEESPRTRNTAAAMPD
jgi:hypothetical protein